MSNNKITEYDSILSCLVTDEGVSKCQEVANHDGWYIYPVSFGISDEQGEFETWRTNYNKLWYENVISGRRVFDKNTISFTCTLPADASDEPHDIREVYLFCRDSNGDRFMLALGQCKTTYTPGEIISPNIIVSILNINALTTFKIIDSCVNDILLHNEDPNAHQDIRDTIKNIVGTTIFIEKSNYHANPGDVVCMNASDGMRTVTLPGNPDNGCKVTVIDSSLIADANNIIVTTGSEQRIDNNGVDFVLDVAGAWVTFEWYARLNTWLVDLGGRNNTPPYYNKKKPITYSSYFTDTVSVWNSTTDYKTSSIVIGPDNCLYIAVNDNGPNTLLGAQMPTTLSTNTAWVLLSNTRIKKTLYGISANMPVMTAPYIKGKNQIAVFIDGVRCSCGDDPEADTYYEDVSVGDGSRSNKIYFHDTLPDTFEVVIVRE